MRSRKENRPDLYTCRTYRRHKRDDIMANRSCLCRRWVSTLICVSYRLSISVLRSEWIMDRLAGCKPSISSLEFALSRVTNQKQAIIRSSACRFFYRKILTFRRVAPVTERSIHSITSQIHWTIISKQIFNLQFLCWAIFNLKLYFYKTNLSLKLILFLRYFPVCLKRFA